MNPAKVPSWLTPHVTQGVTLLGELAQRFPDDAALRPLIGAAVDAWVVYRALLVLGANGDGEALKESRGWLREYRGLMTTLSGLAGELKGPVQDPHAAFHAALEAAASKEDANA